MHMDCSADAGSGCRVMACSCVCLQPLTHRPKLFLRCSSQPLVPGLQCLPSSGSGMSAILPSLLYLQRVVVADLVPCLQRLGCLPKEGRPHPLHGQGNLGSQLLQGVLDMAWNISPVPTNVHPFPAQQASFITMTHLCFFPPLGESSEPRQGAVLGQPEDVEHPSQLHGKIWAISPLWHSGSLEEVKEFKGEAR